MTGALGAVVAALAIVLFERVLELRSVRRELAEARRDLAERADALEHVEGRVDQLAEELDVAQRMADQAHRDRWLDLIAQTPRRHAGRPALRVVDGGPEPDGAA